MYRLTDHQFCEFIISITVAYPISHRLISKSIFDYQLKKRGIELT